MDANRDVNSSKLNSNVDTPCFDNSSSKAEQGMVFKLQNIAAISDP